MTVIVINDFGGIAPIRDRSKLRDPHGMVARECRFEGGNLRARGNIDLQNLAYGFQSDVVNSIFRMTDTQWLKWYGEVAAVKGPTPIVSTSLGDDYRIYYCGDTGDNPVWPRFTTKFEAMGNSDPATFFDGPAVSYPLGVPPPQAAPTVSASAPPSGDIAKMTKTDPVLCEGPTATKHGLKNTNRVILSGMAATGDGSELNNSQYAVSIVNDKDFKLDSVDGSEWTTDVQTVGMKWTRAYAETELTDRIYVFTYVNKFGEEGPQSVASEIVPVADDQTVTITMPTGAAITIGSGPEFAVEKKRIYRSVSGTSALQYQFVAEIPVAQATFVDDVDTGALGEILPTENYDLPPPGLQGIVLHPNGFLVGFVGNKLYLSEPYLPYAWPVDYIKTLEHNIVSLQVFGSTIVILTDSVPYIASATDPGSVAPRDADQVFPCVHRRASISTGYSVVYVSPVGLISFDQSGPRNVTLEYYSAPQWKALIQQFTKPAVILEYQDTRIWMLVAGGSPNMLLSFNMVNQQRTDISSHLEVLNGLRASALAVNRESDELFIMNGDSVEESTRRLYRFDAVNLLTYTWESRRFVLPKEVNFAWVQVFQQFPAGGGSGTTVRLTHDDVSESYLVTSGDPMILTSGYLAGQWSIRLTGVMDIQAVHLATSIEELRQIAL